LNKIINKIKIKINFAQFLYRILFDFSAARPI